MKYIKRIFLFSCCAGLIILNTTCSQERLFSKVIYEATVYDTIYGHPVQGAWVYLYACTPSSTGKGQCNYFLVGQSITDASGHFKIKDQEARSDEYRVIVSPNNHNGAPSFDRANGAYLSKHDTLYQKWRW